jgi:hypothetical protein
MTETKPKPRNLADVIERLLALIPEDQQKLRAELKKVQDSSRYCPPENMGMFWQEGALALQLTIGPDILMPDGTIRPEVTDWRRDVLNVWMGRAA